MAQNGKLGCKMCSEFGFVGSHKTCREVGCLGIHKTLSINF